MRKTIILLILAVSVFLVCACNVVKSPDFYALDENDLVPSFTKVVGSRKVNAKRAGMTNAVETVSYSYKEVENPYGDAEKYIDYLTSEEDFYCSGLLSMDGTEDEINLKKISPHNSEYEIRTIIYYNANTSVVKITVQREKIIK